MAREKARSSEVDLKSLRERKEHLLRGLLAKEGPGSRRALLRILAGQRLEEAEGEALLTEAELGVLSLAAAWVRLARNGDKAYYNRNRHIEPTNACCYRCRFCSYRRDPGAADSWLLTLGAIREKAVAAARDGVTEIHITGGAYPGWGVDDLERIVQTVREVAPRLHIKAFSAVELVAAFQHDGVDFRTGLMRLRDAGLSSIPGGGAEIFADRVRREICPDKCSGEEWLAIHRTWHELGGRSNATMLFGHIETPRERIDHLEHLRRLQDDTGGFNSFIPLKYRAVGNALGVQGEVTLVEVLRTYAVSALYLDNFPHIKAYWPMLGKENMELSLAFGADDLDGTIDDTTRIYSMAGAEDQRPSASVQEFKTLVARAGYVAVERDSEYRELS